MMIEEELFEWFVLHTQKSESSGASTKYVYRLVNDFD